MIDAVLSYHISPNCGVSKFSERLARELGVEFNRMGDSRYKHPLVSVKFAELPDGYMVAAMGPYSLFLHDYDPRGHEVIRNAAVIYAANTVIARQVKTIRPDVIEAWCPSTIEGNHHRGTINVLTFGMAHKIQTARYEKLKTLLDATGEDYTVSVSTAVHEGSPWDETARVGERLRGIFTDRLRVLGYLADDGLAAELQRATAVALFFDPALRANNTTYWACVDARKPVFTNLDEHSPVPTDPVSLMDIDVIQKWPTEFPWFRMNPKREYLRDYSWNGLLKVMQEQPCAK